MNVLFDINHPAHVHFFKNFIDYLQLKGHSVTITARKKEITEELLDLYHYHYKTVSRIRSYKFGLICELLEHQYNLFKILKRNKIDLIYSIGGTFNVHIAKMMGIRSVVFTDSEFAEFTNKITFPFAYKICVPDCFYKDLEKYGKKVIKYKSYHELAYLHPDNFTPDDSVPGECGLLTGEPFFILRFVSWGASHDVGEKGITEKTKLKIIQKLSTAGRVIITSEKELSKEFEKYRLQIQSHKMHHLLAFAKLYVGEGVTMASEAAVLGTPSILVNTLNAGYINDQAESYGLVKQVASENDLLAEIDRSLKIIEHDLKIKRQKLLADKINTTEWMVDLFKREVSQKG